MMIKNIIKLMGIISGIYLLIVFRNIREEKRRRERIKMLNQRFDEMMKIVNQQQ